MKRLIQPTVLLILTLISSILIFSLIFAPRPSRANSEVKNYVIWWPLYTTRWVYRKQHGGVAFMDYNHSSDFPRLRAELEGMIRTHKPDLLVILADWRDLQPLKWAKPGGGKFPDPGVPLNEVIDDELDFEYFDDLIYLANINDVDVILYPIVSAYGGQVPYPFTYYSRVGWFWKRPDWSYGLADPTTEAMRHPGSDQNGASYDWFEHQAGYLDVDYSARHWPLTTNGVEDTGLGEWQVHESADIVFNGYDVSLHSNTLHIHTPIPSFSSDAYRQTTREFFRKIGAHFKNKGILAYYLYQEPTYAHLRENMIYKSGFTGDTGAGDGRWYEVDYSEAEKNRYNQWRQNKGLDSVARIPYPVNSNYNRFREENLADFLNNLKLGLKEGDSDAKVVLSIFFDEFIGGLGANPEVLLQTLNLGVNDVITLEPGHTAKAYFEDGNQLQSFVNLLKRNSVSRSFLSYYIEDTAIDQRAADAFGFNNFWAPAVFNAKEGGYALWSPNNCENCIFRYQTPGTPVPIPTPTPPFSFSLFPGWNEITWPANLADYIASSALADIDSDCGTGTAIAIARKRQDWWKDFVKNYGGENFDCFANQNYFINVIKSCAWTP